MTGLIRDLAETITADVEEAGGKGANRELSKAGLPVPPGFVILKDGYLATTESAGIRAKREDLHQYALASVVGDAQLNAVCDQMRSLVGKVTINGDLRVFLPTTYADITAAGSVAVRSSAIGEDSAASFAGMNASFTSVSGRESLLVKVKDCWASLFSPRANAYRGRTWFLNEPAIAVVVQSMVKAAKSGVAFTSGPRTGGRSEVVEASFGQGKAIVSGAVEPGTYIVSKSDPGILSLRAAPRDSRLFRSTRTPSRRPEWRSTPPSGNCCCARYCPAPVTSGPEQPCAP